MTTDTSDDQLLARMADSEDNYTERKSEGLKDEEIRRTICAFSNSLTAGNTAVLFIGLHDRTGNVVGVGNSDALQKRVREALRRCYPPITNYACRVLKKDGKEVVAVKVGSSDNRPHFTGPAFVRIGSESVEASEAQFHELVANRNGKTARILAMRGKVISVRGLRHPGRRHDVYVDMSQSIDECTVDQCDAHTIRLRIIRSSEHVSKPLDQVQISHDEEKNRPLLIIREAS